MQQPTLTNQVTQPTAATRDIQLLVLDIDGTIAGESNEIREPVKQAVRAAQAKGIQVAIATGRMYQSALRFHRDLGATLPLMVYQGALIKDPATETVHRHWTVPAQLANALLDYFEQPDLRARLSVHFYINDQLYVREMTPETEDYLDRSTIQAIPVGDLRTTLHQEPTKVLALADDVDLINTLLIELRQRYLPTELYLTKSVATFFEATNPLVNKGTAVQYLAEEYLGLQPENVMVVGDNFNDLEMIQYAGIGVAMGNAPDPVKAIANWVAPSVEADGVAAAIEEFLL
ncbi:HAD-superfamily hydrolase, subfamily IIB [Leptolyngbyaceae cyanobacterium JSC-12]|nr:HAD-superfamily hydrolase, subfamily IIB [Leptolyngbyaceae cyanobacterium JSC-12]